MADTIETQLENYHLHEELSQNSVVTVYHGERKADGTAVIIKVIAPLFAADEFFARRLRQATRQTAKLEHPNIVPNHEVEQEGELLYLVEELDLSGVRSLAQVLAAEGSFSLHRAQFITRQIASALDYAHQKSVTHGDLSANQIYLGADDLVLITNFGQTQAIFGVNMMRQGYNASSPETMAPERVHGQGPSRHSDLYALGILSYQMLAGKPPFTGSPATVLHAQAYKQVRPLYLLNPGIPMAVSEVVERMLSKGLELRYNTGAEFARALSVACENAKKVHHRPMPFQQKHYTPVSPKMSALLVMAVAFLAIGLIYAGYRFGVQSQPPVVVTIPSPIAALSAEVSLLPTSTLAPSPQTATRPAPTTLSDTLLPPLTLTANPSGISQDSDTLLPSPTPSPTVTTSPVTPTPTVTPSLPAQAPVAQPAAVVVSASQPFVPAGQAVLVFTNPTGHDLIVDLTGPTSTSNLVPPGQQHEFILTPGHYQMNLHTPTGQHLASRILTFDLLAGQAVPKDYYTDYDAQAQLANN